jgi:hypothetical protein
MKTILPAVLVLAALAAGGWWLWSQSDGGYDYGAKFENLPDADPSAEWRLADFAGKPRDAAEQALGRPQACEAALHSTRCRYAGGVEVVYIEERADWITIRFPYGRHPLNAAALQRLGLPALAPSAEDEHSLLWTGLPGLHDVHIVGDENGVLYARIRVRHG